MTDHAWVMSLRDKGKRQCENCGIFEREATFLAVETCEQTPIVLQALESAIGQVVLEDSPGVMGDASDKKQHTRNDLRMMQGYRHAVIRAALRKLGKKVDSPYAPR